jgi:hypothetical protein
MLTALVFLTAVMLFAAVLAWLILQLDAAQQRPSPEGNWRSTPT